MSKTVNRREMIRAIGGISALALTPWQRARATWGKKPNVLYVFSDMQRANTLGCYGDPNAHTPRLDAFAKEGALLTAAISNTPVCCPHRACLMSGLYSHNHGVLSNSVQPKEWKQPALAETFKKAGYVTGYAGKWHIPGYSHEQLGFPPEKPLKAKDGGAHHIVIDGEKIYKPTYFTDQAIRYIEEKSRGESPWLYVLSWIPPHTPYAAPGKYAERYRNCSLALNVPEGAPMQHAKKDMPEYYGMCESLDAEFGRLLDTLRRVGAADNTIVIYSSDHGDMVGSQGIGKKRWPYQESARVPFLIRYPGAIKAGTVLDDPMGTPDVYPTLAGLAGVDAPEGLDGADFSPLLTRKSKVPPRDYVFLQMHYAYVPWPGWRALRTRKYSYASTVEGPWLLFDIEKDPFELRNLVKEPASRGIVEEMDARLASIMKETGDSWELKATTGDLQNWLPGGPKQRACYMGVKWPGYVPSAATGDGGGKSGSRGKGKKKKG